MGKTLWLSNLLAIVILCSLVTGIWAQDGEDETRNPWQVTISPKIRYIAVDGDERKFEEDWWMEEGWGGGLESFQVEKQFGEEKSLDVYGHILEPEHDYKINALYSKAGLGYIQGGFSQYRTYDDDTGGFFRLFSVPYFDLNRELELDRGHIYLEAGLERGKWPQIVLGYEHRFKDGQKSLLEWGSVSEDGITRKIFPAYQDIDEEVDIFKVEIEHEVGKVELEDQFRYEDYRRDSTRYEQERDLTSVAAGSVTVSEEFDYQAYFNTFQMESQPNDQTYWSIGYLLTDLDGDGNFAMVTLPFDSPFDKNWTAQAIDVGEKTHMVNANALFGPYYDLTVYGGLQAEKTETDGNTDALLTEINFGGTAVAPDADIISRRDKSALQETVGARYKGIPRTVLYVEGKWAQQNIDLFERELEDDALGFERYTDTDVDRQRYTVGFNVSPFGRASLSVRYRRRNHSNNYDNLVDSTTSAYSAFIEDQDLTTDEFTSRFSFRPSAILKVSIQYQYIHTEYDTLFDTPSPAKVETGDYQSDVYGLDFTLTPVGRMYLTGLFTYRDSKTSTFSNDVPAVTSYEGDVFTAIGTLGYALNERSDLLVQYLFSRADNYIDISDQGYPFGMDKRRHRVLATWERRITDNLKTRFQYGYYRYDEDSDNGVDDYEAHMLGAGFSFQF